MQAPAQMQLWTKCEHQPKHEYPHHNLIHKASHDRGTRNACQQSDAPTMYTTTHYQCGDGIGWRACSLDRVGPRWGKDLLKGRGGVSALLSPSYFYIVDIPSHVNIFLVDKEYILHCHLPENKKTCEKNIFWTEGWASQLHAIIYIQHIQMCWAQIQSTH